MPDTAPPQTRPGLFGSLRALLTTLVSISATRLGILVTEYEQEKLRLGRMLVLWTALAFFAAMAMVFLSLLAVMLAWEEHRVAVIACIIVAYTALAAVAAGWLRHEMRRGPRFLSISLAELQQDRRELET